MTTFVAIAGYVVPDQSIVFLERWSTILEPSNFRHSSQVIKTFSSWMA